MSGVNRSAALYRYSLPMEAGVVLRNQRLKTRDGWAVQLRQGEREGWGEICAAAGIQPGNVGAGRTGRVGLAAGLVGGQRTG